MHATVHGCLATKLIKKSVKIFFQGYSQNQPITRQEYQIHPNSAGASSFRESRSCVDGWTYAFGTSASVGPSNSTALVVRTANSRDGLINTRVEHYPFPLKFPVVESALAGILGPNNFKSVTKTGRSDLEVGLAVGLKSRNAENIHHRTYKALVRPY